MVHKFCLIALLSIGLLFTASAKKDVARIAFKTQPLINVNPDPNGEPWIVGGLPEWTPELQKKMEQIPVLDMSKRRISLPSSVDNSKKQFFRGVFNQGNFGSCAQSSSMGYTFTYEVNRLKNSDATTTNNQLPPLFTYNFLNDGRGANGSMITDGWDIVNTHGCPTIPEFGGTGISDDSTKWMSGYAKYYGAMSLKVPKVYRIITNTPEGINSLKQWLYDHGNGAQGAIVNFAAGAGTIQPNGGGIAKLASGTPQAGKSVVTKFATNMDHAMSIVGYDDSVRYDYNGDKKYANEGTDVTKWEIGAFIMLNTWGTSWADAGFAYLPYKVMADAMSNGGIAGNYVYGCEAKIDYKALMTYKVTIKHTKRNDISIKAGVATDPNATQPEKTIQLGAFNYQGGALKMGGKNGSDQLEAGLDVTPLLQYLNAPKNKFFLIVDTKEGGNGTIVSFSLLDYRGGSTPTETACSEQNVALKAGTNLLSIAYESKNADLAISTNELPKGAVGKDYSTKLDASGGKSPYSWSINTNTYVQQTITETFPAITDKKLTPDTDDDGFAGQELQFEFPYYGTKYKKVYLSTDGSLGFEPVYECVRHASAIPHSKTITPIGMDFKITGSGGMYYKGDATSATLRWNITSMTDGSEVNFDVAVILYPSGEFKMFYNKSFTKNTVDFACGFSSGNLKDYVLFPYSNTSNIPEGLSLKFTPFVIPQGLVFS
ncbi:MAG: hypothetical protein JW795_20415, partial [Chitinivibrionales bacterium]|nr:hypothetical protein [Chitinivibrionales bacterium]